MISVKFIQKARKQRPDGTRPVWLQIIENRRYKFVYTGISVKSDQWNSERGRVRKNHPASDSLNSRLDTFMVKVMNTQAELERDDRASLETLSQALKRNGNSVLLNEYAAPLINSMLEAKRYHPARATQVAVNKFIQFRKGKSTAVTEITSSVLTLFATWLRTELDNKPNTIAKDIEGLRRILKQAEKDGLIKSVPKAEGVQREKTTKDKLHPDQIRAIEALVLKQNSREWHARNYFLFSYYYAGIRWGDVCTMKWSNIKNGKLAYVMQKTGKKYPYPFKMGESMLRILDYYDHVDKTHDDFIFPILKAGKNYSDVNLLNKQIDSGNTMVNVDLKKIAQLAGIETNVSFHVARHSAAYRMLLEDVDIYTISKALAHENVSITETYLRGIDDTLVVSKMELVYESK
jgi:integrase